MGQLRQMQQFMQFGLVGALNTAVTYLIYLLFVHAASPAGAMAIGYGLTAIIGFMINRHQVFKHSGSLQRTLLKYGTTYGFTLGLSSYLSYAFTTFGQISATITPVFTLMITVPLNFLLCKFWVFRE